MFIDGGIRNPFLEGLPYHCTLCVKEVVDISNFPWKILLYDMLVYSHALCVNSDV